MAADATDSEANAAAGPLLLLLRSANCSGARRACCWLFAASVSPERLSRPAPGAVVKVGILPAFHEREWLEQLC